MSVSEREQAMLVHRERRMAIMIAAYAASSTKGANHDILSLKKDVKRSKRKRKPQRWRPLGFSAYKNRHGFDLFFAFFTVLFY